MDHQIPYAEAEQLGLLLQTAAWVTIAYLSGMRDSEVKHLRRGCLSVSRAEDGRIYRRKISGLAFKGENDPVGVPATWIVGEPVERAVSVLERLHSGQHAYLFARIPGSRRDLARMPPGRKAPGRPTVISSRSPTGSTATASSTAAATASRSSRGRAGG